MTYTLRFTLAPDGTTRLGLDRDRLEEPVPLPRELIVDGHCTRPHPDLVAAMVWLCWPQAYNGVVSFGTAVTPSMARALGEPGARVSPRHVSDTIERRQVAPSTLVLDSSGAPGRGRNPLGEPRSTFLDIRPIHRWRGRMMSTDVLAVCSNADAFAAQSSRRYGSPLAAPLAVALLFADELRINRIVACGYRADSRWLEATSRMLEACDIQLFLTEGESDLWRQVWVP